MTKSLLDSRPITISKSNAASDSVLSSSFALIRLLLLDIGSTESRPHAAPHLGVQQGAQEHHPRAHPVPPGERVLEVHDGEDEAEELSQRHHQSDGQRGALRGEDENPANAHISERKWLKSVARV